MADAKELDPPAAALGQGFSEERWTHVRCLGLSIVLSSMTTY